MQKFENIKNVNDLVECKLYWYISVPQCCHFNNLKVKHACFVGGTNKGMNKLSVEGMILFDSAEKAENYLKMLKERIDKFVITTSVDDDL